MIRLIDIHSSGLYTRLHKVLNQWITIEVLNTCRFILDSRSHNNQSKVNLWTESYINETRIINNLASVYPVNKKHFQIIF